MIGGHLLVTGGAGSFGRAFVRSVLEAPNGPHRVTVFSRDERKQSDMGQELAHHGSRLRFILGDVRDAGRLEEGLAGVDTVVHAAAIKHVPVAEANPYECVRTNVEGSRNLIVAARRQGVARVVALSSDKAVAPSTAYGASKMLMERLLLQATVDGPTRFSVVRYANVFGSSGSVVPLFLRLKASGVLPVTDPAMTRFSMTIEEAIDLVLFTLMEGVGGEIVVPIAPSYRVADVAAAIAPDAQHRIVGRRPGEKMHETMFALEEAPFVVRRGTRYVIAPRSDHWTVSKYAAEFNGEIFAAEAEYNSLSNDHWLSVGDIRAMLEKSSAA